MIVISTKQDLMIIKQYFAINIGFGISSINSSKNKRGGLPGEKERA